MSQIEETTPAKTLVPAIAKMLQEQHPEDEVLAVNVVYVVVRHDGAEDHKACKLVGRHCGGLRTPDQRVFEAIANATVESGENLTERVSATNILAALGGAAVAKDKEPTDGE